MELFDTVVIDVAVFTVIYSECFFFKLGWWLIDWRVGVDSLECPGVPGEVM